MSSHESPGATPDATPETTRTPPSHPLSPAQILELQRRALEVAHHAYAPYSHFRVGAALLLEQPSDIVTGCNVENASYRLTVCAEQAAIAAAVGLYGPTIRIRAITVTTLNGVACQPCGACRQTIQEFSGPDTLIIYPSAPNTFSQTTIGEILPAAFHLKS